MINLTDTEKKRTLYATFNITFLLLMQMLIYQLLGSESDIVHMVIVAVCVAMMLNVVPIWIRKHCVCTVFYIAIFASTFLVQLVLFPENREVLLYYSYSFFCMCLPCYINMTMVRDDAAILNTLKVFSLVMCIAGELYFVLYLMKSNTFSDASYQMAYTYYMLVPALYFTYDFFNRKKLSSAVLTAAVIIPMVIIGSRGALVAWLLFFILEMLFSHLQRQLKVLVIVVLIALMLYGRQLLKVCELMLARLGLSSRTLYLIESSQIFQDSGRKEAYSNAIGMVTNHPILGNGVGAFESAFNIYSHNVFLDVLLHFGFIFGGVLIVVGITVIICAFINTKNKDLFFVFLCWGGIPCLFSGTYLSSIAFWIFLGYCVANVNLKFSLSKSKYVT